MVRLVQTIKPRIASPAALLQCCSVGFQTLTVYYWRHAALTHVPRSLCCHGRRLRNVQSAVGRCSMCLHPERPVRKTRGSGAVDFIFFLARAWGFGEYLSIFALQIDTRTPVKILSCLALVPLTYFAYCPVGSLCFVVFLIVFLLRRSLWMSSRLGQGRNTQADKSYHLKPAPKRLRTCFDCETNPRHLRGLLPAWSTFE